ncbi:hypothetical protein CANMA_004696 [Candida margitis]|uniref:uncharacterized protein n=1 Tax=Candida margitis TaxID=1775924 RepID=UPI002227A952|nr:uncharacterized protein CANMA_004696 [Candida margitis]KAI5953858.1 hypothetical protein CANMA_004696 [Candida margitis]
MSQIQEQLENIPGYDIVMDKFNDYAEEHWNNTDPYTDKETGKKLKLPPDITTKQEQKAWAKIQSMAWTDDKCLCGSCGVGMDCGLGLVPFAVFFFPVLGPLVMYMIHMRLLSLANEQFHLPGKLMAQMQANIGLDLLITFPPVIGSFFGWMHQCSTRNAGMIYCCVVKMAKERQAQGGGVKYSGSGVTAGQYGGNEGHFGQSSMQYQQQQTRGVQQQQQQRNIRAGQYGQPQQPKPAYVSSQSRGKRTGPNSIEVGQQQQSGFV